MLTPKQEAFAKLVAEGSSQADAYRQAFNSKGKPKSVIPEASRLMANPNVSARVDALRQELAERSLWSRLDSVQVLAEIAKGQDAEAKPSDRVNAVKALNSMHGWDKLSIDHTTAGQPIQANQDAVLAALSRKHRD